MTSSVAGNHTSCGEDVLVDCIMKVPQATHKVKAHLPSHQPRTWDPLLRPRSAKLLHLRWCVNAYRYLVENLQCPSFALCSFWELFKAYVSLDG